jgi:hypothetical protein
MLRGEAGIEITAPSEYKLSQHETRDLTRECPGATGREAEAGFEFTA